MPRNMKKKKINTSCGLLWRCIRTQASRQAENEGWELLIRNISPDVHSSLGQFSHVCWRLSMLFNPREISDQRFSIGFKSGDVAEQFMCCTFSCSRKSMTYRARYAGVLSSWNTKFTWKSLIYFPGDVCTGTDPWINPVDFPLLWKAPHIVTPPRPPTCTLDNTHSSSRVLWACLHTRTRPS